MMQICQIASKNYFSWLVRSSCPFLFIYFSKYTLDYAPRGGCVRTIHNATAVWSRDQCYSELKKSDMSRIER